LSEFASPETFERLTAASRAIHGHRYVLSVAAWIEASDKETVSTRDAMQALGGNADRARAIEALVKLAEIGALEEMPRDEQVNSPREFARNREDPYWSYAATTAARIAAEGQIAERDG
jgi:hypothetical protein